ncbi:MAG: response regulator transcription factor [Spirochaetia bacterium]|nr:response regulator transcription factor [Spirochaetia bacterium]
MPFTLLIIDDDRIFCDELCETLDEYETKIALSPQQALEILSAPNSVDLVLLDVRLPGMWGTELLKIIKSRYSRISVIIMTAFASKEVIVGALRNQADDFVEKPIDIIQLKERIQNLLETSGEITNCSNDVEYLKYYLQKNEDKKIEIDDLARLMGYTPKYMSRLFKQKMGTTFIEYRVNQKVERAKRLLSTTDWPIKRIAYSITYENPESFVRIFKKKTGYTPSQYRNKAISS